MTAPRKAPAATWPDRNYLRQLYDSELIDRASTELEIVLAERLELANSLVDEQA